MFDAINEEAIHHLNFGTAVSAEIPPTQHDNRAFVAVIPVKKADAPAEDYRYLNSKHSMFEVYEFHVVRIELRRGYEQHEDDYDYFRVSENSAVVHSQKELDAKVKGWLPKGIPLIPNRDTDCPL